MFLQVCCGSWIALLTRTVARPKGVVSGFEDDPVFGGEGLAIGARHLVEAP